jgi:leader peptidase (prepilin peptidase)/N-methyltransferase
MTWEWLYESLSWAGMPFHFWTIVMFVLGAIVGSFLNVCIHRMPHDLSLMRPGSHCPACGHAIPLRLNIPLVSWLWLRGRCAFCGTTISVRYLLVELVTALLFTATWLAFGRESWALPLVYSIFLAGLTVATFVDFEHFIIPDAITLGGIGVGFASAFLVPELFGLASPVEATQRSMMGAALGAGVVYGLLRLGKALFGRQRLKLPPNSRVVFGEEDLHLPTERIPYGELLYRRTDAVHLHASRVEMVDCCYRDVTVTLSQETLRIGDREFKTGEVPGFEVVTSELVAPREAMGLGDVKFMAAIGAFVGWQGVFFSLLGSAVLGSLVGVALIATGRRAWSSRMPYGPYIALAAAVWIFAGPPVWRWWWGG